MARKTYVDLLRIVSCIAVIVIHVVTASVAATTPAGQGILNSTTLIHALMNWSVPVFYMITGYCLALKEDCSYQYCLKHVMRYVVVLFTVGMFYGVLEQIYIVNAVNVTVFVTAFLNVISGNLWEHMWFVYSIIGIYLVMPVIHRYGKDNEKGMLYLCAVLFVFTIVIPFCEKWVPIGFTIPFGEYLFYVCFGCLLAKHKVRSYEKYLGILAGVGAIIWIVLRYRTEAFGYNHLAVSMLAMCIFLCVCDVPIKDTMVLRAVAQCSFGIYLFHPLLLNVALKVLRIDVVTSYPYVKMLLMTIAVYVMSLVMTLVLRKVPGVKKFI